MRIIVLLLMLLPSAAMAGTRYASDVTDCHSHFGLNGVVLSEEALEQNELYCPRRHWQPSKTGYTADCAQEESTPYKLNFSLTHQSDGSLLYAEKDYSVTLHRCR
jgi:hypothetical protein